MHGWKTKLGAVLFALAPIGDLFYDGLTGILNGLGAAFAAFGIGHKIEKNITKKGKDYAP